MCAYVRMWLCTCARVCVCIYICVRMPNFMPYYCNAFSIKYGNHTFEMFHWVKMPPKLVKSTDRDQNIIRWSGYNSIWYFRPFPHAFSRKCPKTLNLTRFTRFFGLCDLEICHTTLEIWKPQAGVSNHLIKYQGNRWWIVLAKAGTDGQTDGRTVCRSEEWHKLHIITPNKWPKHKRKHLRKIGNGAWAYIVLRRCQTNVLPSYVYQENIIFKWPKEKGDFFRFQRCV